MKERLEMSEDTFLHRAREENNQPVSVGSLKGVLQRKKALKIETSLPKTKLRLQAFGLVPKIETNS